MAEDVHIAKQAVFMMNHYLTTLGIPELKDAVTIYLFHDLDEHIANYVELTGGSRDNARQVTAAATAHWIFVVTGADWYTPRELKYRMPVFSHELVHSYQRQLGDTAGGRDLGPTWMTEGIAEYLGYGALSVPWIIPYNQYRKRGNAPWSFVDRGSRVPFKPKELETYKVFREANPLGGYSFCLLAAELLAAHSGESSLLSFYRRLELGRTWQEAFEAAFGMPVEEFYELFEAHREAGFPELDLPKEKQE